MAFQPVFSNFPTRPPTATLKRPSIGLHAVRFSTVSLYTCINVLQQLIRDQLPISTWLLLGALIQGTATALLPYRNIVMILPVLLVLSYKATTTLLVLLGVLSNPRMNGVIPYRTTAVLPTEKGLPSKPGESSVCAIVLAAVSHHPLGMLAPGFSEVGSRFDAMLEEMSADATRYGFLGASSWINAGDHTTRSENMNILYFENEHHLHAYAHGPMHSKAMSWWRETEKKNRHVGIMHEVFACPKRGWEAIYVNYQPVGLGSTSKEVTDEKGQKSWVSPLVKIKGSLLYSNGRMGRNVAENEWDSLTKLKPEELDV